MLCPLCSHTANNPFNSPLEVKLWHCSNCELVFKDPESRPSLGEEEARYLEHNNDGGEKGYVDFLKLAINPAMEFFEPRMDGMDYGCGPNPVLSTIIKAAGHDCFNYDPIFFPELPDERMDYIFATESFEHFFNPLREMKLITALLRPGGILTVMTHRWKELDQVADWWYLRDKTHVAFFHKKTFDYICHQFGFAILFDDGEKVMVMEKEVVVDRT